MKVPKPYLINIVQSIDAIESYMPKDFASFSKDSLRQDAVLMRLQDVGENLIQMRDAFPEFWESNSKDSWVRAIGLRNIISHGYGKIDLAIIWSLVSDDLAKFKRSIQRSKKDL